MGRQSKQTHFEGDPCVGLWRSVVAQLMKDGLYGRGGERAGAVHYLLDEPPRADREFVFLAAGLDPEGTVDRMVALIYSYHLRLARGVRPARSKDGKRYVWQRVTLARRREAREFLESVLGQRLQARYFEKHREAPREEDLLEAFAISMEAV